MSKSAFFPVMIPLAIVILYYLNSIGYISIPYQLGSVLHQINPLFAVITACVLYADDSLVSVLTDGTLRFVYRLVAGGFLSYLGNIL